MYHFSSAMNSHQNPRKYLRILIFLLPALATLPARGALPQFPAGYTEAAQLFESSCTALDSSTIETKLELQVEAEESGLIITGDTQTQLYRTADTLAHLARLSGFVHFSPIKIRIRNDKDGFLLHQPGAPAQRHARPCAGMRALLALLIKQNEQLPVGWRQQADIVATAPLPLLLHLAPPLLQAGNINVFQGNSLKITLPPGTQHIEAPEGLSATKEGDSVILRRTGASKSGLREILFFSGSNRLTPLARARILVLAGSGAGEAPEAIAPRPASPSLALGQSAAGKIESGKTQDWQLKVPQTGMWRLESAGATDVRAQLLNADGTVIAQDDDGAGNYNFRLARELPQGDYILRVQHCCGGAGDYTLHSTAD